MPIHTLAPTWLGLISLILACISFASSLKSGRRNTYAVTTGILSLIALFLLSLSIYGREYVFFEGLGKELVLVLSCDTVSLIVILTIVIVGIAALLESYRYMEKYREKGYVPYYLLTLAFIYSMILVALVRSWLWFLVLFEVMTLTSYFLIGYEYYEKQIARIAWNYFVTMHILCTTPLILAVALTYSVTGTFEFTSITGPQTTIISLLFLLGFATKSGLFPVHFWLPDAHPAAPSPISALLSGAMVKLGVYGMFRVVEHVGVLDPLVRNIIIVLAILSTLVGVASYARQRDIKRLFAWSTIDNMGWMYLIIAIAGAGGGLTLSLYVLNHGLAKAAVFLCTGLILYTLNTRDMRRLVGAYNKYRLITGVLIVSILALEGVPPFNFFWNKFSVVRLALEYNTALGIYYAILWCIAFVIFLHIIHQLISVKSTGENTTSNSSSSDDESIGSEKVPASMILSVILLLALLLVSQVLANFLVAMVGGG